MGQTKKIRGTDGEIRDHTEVAFRNAEEHWNEYLLDDGTVMRAKLVVKAVYRIEGEFDQLGRPRYWFDSAKVVAISVAENGEDK